jgi:hypothetical protein
MRPNTASAHGRLGAGLSGGSTLGEVLVGEGRLISETDGCELGAPPLQEVRKSTVSAAVVRVGRRRDRWFAIHRIVR